MAFLGRVLDQISWSNAILIALVLGLAPFFPEPHIWEKLKMLAAGELSRPIDIFDLLMHGAPFLIVILKGLRQMGQGA